MENNYYYDILAQINQLIIEKKWEEAHFMIRSELNVPYVPNDVETKLQKYLAKVEQHFGKRELKKLMTEEEFEENIFSMQKETRIKAILQLEKQNGAPYIILFESFFASSTITNHEKTLLLIQLQQQRLNYEFTIKKNGKSMVINPANFTLNFAMRRFKEVMFIYYKLDGEKNITNQNHFSELLMNFINFYVPFEIPFEAWEIALGTMKVLKTMLNEEFDEHVHIVDFEIDYDKVQEVIVLYNKVLED